MSKVKNLELKDRIWKCENCGETLNRDLNAALNIRDLGTKKFFDNLKKQETKTGWCDIQFNYSEEVGYNFC